MRTVTRRHPLYLSLLALLVVDLLALLAFLFDQWVAGTFGASWLLAAVLTAAAMPWLLKLADKVFDAALECSNIPETGGKIP